MCVNDYINCVICLTVTVFLFLFFFFLRRGLFFSLGSMLSFPFFQIHRKLFFFGTGVGRSFLLFSEWLLREVQSRRGPRSLVRTRLTMAALAWIRWVGFSLKIMALLAARTYVSSSIIVIIVDDVGFFKVLRNDVFGKKLLRWWGFIPLRILPLTIKEREFQGWNQSDFLMSDDRADDDEAYVSFQVLLCLAVLNCDVV